MEQETPSINFTEKAEVDESFYLRHIRNPVDGDKIWKRAAIDLTFGLRCASVLALALACSCTIQSHMESHESTLRLHQRR